MSGLPYWSDFPLVGYAEWTKVQQIASELEKIDIKKLVEGHDGWTQGALREVYEWYTTVNRLADDQGERDWALIGAYQ